MGITGKNIMRRFEKMHEFDENKDDMKYALKEIHQISLRKGYLSVAWDR